MDTAPNTSPQPAGSKRHIVLLGFAYSLSAIPLVIWIVWPWLIGDTSGEAYRSTFGILLGLPIIGFIGAIFAILLFKKSVKFAALPALFLALLVALLCYFIASSTVEP